MPTTPVVLIFGAGSNIGLATAKRFRAGGYKVAAVSRHPSNEMESLAHLILPADLADPTSVKSVFEKTTAELGVPTVVVYNAFDARFMSLDNILGKANIEHVAQTLAVNVTSAYAAASLAVDGWAGLPADSGAAKVFLYTGNMTTTQIYPGMHTLGMGKNAAAYFIESAAVAYGGKYKFYYVDERDEKGESVMAAVDGEGNAEAFWELAGKMEQGPWNWTFVNGKGYGKLEGWKDRDVRMVGFPGLPEGGIAYEEVRKMMAAQKE